MDSAKGLRQVSTWLWVCVALVLAMVAVGGLTRLTRSGLSIVEWQPVTGVLPPLSEEAWASAHAAYRASPEGRLVNPHLDLAGFQRIYYVEWFHRLLGRVLGAAFLVPWLAFALRGVLGRRRALRLLGWFVLGGLQGAMGWFMVKSGLVDEPRVSPLRLTAHLLLALGLLGGLTWEALALRRPRPARGAGPLGGWVRAACALLVLTLAWGGLMAGHKAGWVSDTFPKMLGHWVPPLAPAGEPLWRAALESMVAVHFVHRVLGLLTLALALHTARLALGAAGPARALGLALGVGALVQVGLGILTVLWHVPLGLAVAHQVNGALLLGVTVALVYFTPLRAAGQPEALPALGGGAAGA